MTGRPTDLTDAVILKYQRRHSSDVLRFSYATGPEWLVELVGQILDERHVPRPERKMAACFTQGGVHAR